MTKTGIAYLCLVFVMSIVTCIIYGFDKHVPATVAGESPNERSTSWRSWVVGPVP